jgi:hypothetical protein
VSLRRRLACGALAVLLPAVAAAEVKDATASGFTLENSQWVPVAPEAAWTHLVRDVGRWWPADHTWWGDASNLSIRAEAGGCLCEIAGDRQAWHMTVSLVDPGKLMRMTGGLGPLQGMGLHGALEWRFAAEGEGTRITLWYRAGGYAPDDLSGSAAIVDRVQGQQLGALAQFIRSAVAAPAADDSVSAPPL